MGMPKIGQTEDGHSFIGGDPSKQENWKAVGAVEDGHVFKGGDPSKAESWASVNQPMAPAPPQTSALETGIESFGNQASFGYLPQIQAATEPLVQGAMGLFGDNIDEKLRAQGFNIQESAPTTYLQRRDENIARQQLQKSENPDAALYSGLAGGLVSGIATGGALGSLGLGGRAASFGGRLAQAAGTGAVTGAIRNPGDTQGEVSPFQPTERAENMALDAATGAVFQGGLEGAGKIGSLLKNAPKTLKSYSELKALKGSGAMLKDFRTAFEKGKAYKLGEAAIDEGLIAMGDDIADVAQKAKAVKGEVGNNIGKVYDKADELASEAIKNSPKSREASLIDDELNNMKNDILQADAGKRGAAYNDATGEYFNTSTQSSFPEWNKGASKQTTLDALERKSGPVYDRLVEQAKDNLRRGYLSPQSGPIPPNPEFLAMEKGGDIVSNLKQHYSDELLNPLYTDIEKAALKKELADKIAVHSGPKIDLDFKTIADEFSKKVADKYQGKAGGSDIVKKIQNILDDISINDQVSFKKAKEIRESIDDLIDHGVATKEMSSIQKELSDLRNVVQGKVKAGLKEIDNYHGTDLNGAFTKENRRFSNLSYLSKMASDKVAREESNASFGLRERMAGGIGAIVGGGVGASLGGPMGAAIGAGVGGGLNAITTKAARQYGTPFVAMTANKIAKKLIENPGSLGKFSESLIKASEVSPAKFVSAVNLMMKDPEYKKMNNGGFTRGSK